MLIDRTYFVGDLNIPNTSTAAIGSLLDWFIEKYEEKFLLDAFGYSLYKAFKAGMQDDPVAQKWTDLIEGVEYTDLSGITRYWRGLISSVSGDITIEISPIACYVYYWFMRNNHSQTATMGEVKSKNENAVSHNPALKMVRAWNEMSQAIRDLKHFLDAKQSDYPEWKDHDSWRMLRLFAPINEFNI